MSFLLDNKYLMEDAGKAIEDEWIESEGEF